MGMGDDAHRRLRRDHRRAEAGGAAGLGSGRTVADRSARRHDHRLCRAMDGGERPGAGHHRRAASRRHRRRRDGGPVAGGHGGIVHRAERDRRGERRPCRRADVIDPPSATEHGGDGPRRPALRPCRDRGIRGLGHAGEVFRAGIARRDLLSRFHRHVVWGHRQPGNEHGCADGGDSPRGRRGGPVSAVA